MRDIKSSFVKHPGVTPSDIEPSHHFTLNDISASRSGENVTVSMFLIQCYKRKQQKDELLNHQYCRVSGINGVLANAQASYQCFGYKLYLFFRYRSAFGHDHSLAKIKSIFWCPNLTNYFGNQCTFFHRGWCLARMKRKQNVFFLILACWYAHVIEMRRCGD